MYVKTENDTERPGMLIKLLEDLPGGAVLNTSNIDTTKTKEIKEGAIVVVYNGIAFLYKTAEIIETDGTAVTVAKNHEFITGDYVTDGIVSRRIVSIDFQENKDIFILSGILRVNNPHLIGYSPSQYEYDGLATDSIAVLTGYVTDVLQITIPKGPNAASANGRQVTLVQAADDNLAVTLHESGNVTIALAKTTASKNNAAAIQAALRDAGDYLALCTVSGSAGWDDEQTGAVLTDPVVTFSGGTDYLFQIPEITSEYVVGVLMNTVDISEPGMNNSSGILMKGTVIENLLPYPVNDYIKSLLPNITFVTILQQ